MFREADRSNTHQATESKTSEYQDNHVIYLLPPEKSIIFAVLLWPNQLILLKPEYVKLTLWLLAIHSIFQFESCLSSLGFIAL